MKLMIILQSPSSDFELCTLRLFFYSKYVNSFHTMHNKDIHSLHATHGMAANTPAIGPTKYFFH